jgi:hypothetical protein
MYPVRQGEHRPLLRSLNAKETRMIKKIFMAAAGLVTVMSPVSAALAADHKDSPAVNADPAADINDLYSFVDGGALVVAMTTFPAASFGSAFSDQVQYIFHTTSGAAFGSMTSTLDVVCTFDAAQMITCLAGEGPTAPVLDRAVGNAGSPAGLPGEKGLITVFAGLRKDPFFFNLEGFNAAVGMIKNAAPNFSYDAAGCPLLDAATSAVLVQQLKSSSMGGAAMDFFKPLNTLAIVVKIDPSLVGPIVSVWTSTNTF